LGGKLLDGLAGAWDRYAAIWRMMRDGALDTVAALRQVAGVALPSALAGTLALTPALATPLPSVAMNAGPAAMPAPVAEPAPANVIRVPQFAEAPATIPPAVHVAPMISVAAAAERPAPTVVKEREVERTRMLAERVMTLAPAASTHTGPSDAQPPLAALLSKLDALGDRPIDVNVTVVSKLDGRAIAQAVYKDIRQQKVKNYETL